MSNRYVRQRLLASVGDLGQERIAQATYVVSGEAEIERDYLTRAGARHVSTSDLPEAAFVHAAHFRNPAARELAAGAWRALKQLRRALERD